MHRRTRSTVVAVASLTALVGVGVGACAESPSTEASDPSVTSRTSKSPKPSPKPSAQTSPTETPATSVATPVTTPTTESASTATPTASASSAPTSPAPDPDSSPRRARQAQIPRSELPGFNEQWRWTDSKQVKDAKSLCMRSPLTSIGAVNQVSTKFGNADTMTATAVQITGVFPDEHTALTATAVLTAWHDKCGAFATEEVGLKRVDVSDIRSVPTSVGSGRQWMVTYRPVPGEPDSVWFNSEGFIRDGDTITYLAYKSAGQDYNYPAGQEPIDRALVVAASYLKQTRGR